MAMTMAMAAADAQFSKKCQNSAAITFCAISYLKG